MAKYETVASLIRAVKGIDFDRSNAFDKLQALVPDISNEVQKWVDFNPQGALMGKIESALREGHINSAKRYQRDLKA